jgi:hypothetical protein
VYCDQGSLSAINAHNIIPKLKEKSVIYFMTTHRKGNTNVCEQGRKTP